MVPTPCPRIVPVAGSTTDGAMERGIYFEHNLDIAIMLAVTPIFVGNYLSNMPRCRHPKDGFVKLVCVHFESL